MLDVLDILDRLATKRPVFHSEADFQHALVWDIHTYLPDAGVRLEYRYPGINKATYLDAWVVCKNYKIALELKYKTKKLTVTVADEEFLLKGQGAPDCGKYDFLKDINRLEAVVANDRSVEGFAILLTNDSAYWKQPTNINSNDYQFRLTEGRHLSGAFDWGSNTGVGTKRDRESPIELIGQYQVNWTDYSGLVPGFRVLVVRV